MSSVHEAATAHAIETRVWSMLRQLADRARRGHAVRERTGLTLDRRGQLHEISEREALIVARPDLDVGWSAPARLDRGASQLLDLYMPLCVGAGSDCLILAHLGQSADGHVATFSGSSKFITGEADIEHTHRLRALFDAVLVGASTIAIDDPQLTTRLVAGRTPVRVVLDPTRRLPPHHTVFADRAARTLLVVDDASDRDRPGHVDVLAIRRRSDGEFDLAVLMERLRERGLRRVFIEGGGV
ncbi:MAG TPA: RibD family protein, partial [Polyangiales bacterium]|nr:RibD family protein [Polyangiales bacterium]